MLILFAMYVAYLTVMYQFVVQYPALLSPSGMMTTESYLVCVSFCDVDH
jgi:hypothetical protein